MKKEQIGREIPLLFACSGGSDAAELAEAAARKLFADEYVYMSCVPVITARVEKVLDKLKKDEKVVVLDGCGTDCVAKTLRLYGFDGFLHIKLNDIGISKDKARNEISQLEKVYNYVLEKIKDEKIWAANKFSYSPGKDKLA